MFLPVSFDHLFRLILQVPVNCITFDHLFKSFGASHSPIQRRSSQTSWIDQSRCTSVFLGPAGMISSKLSAYIGHTPWFCGQGNTLLHDIFDVELEEKRVRVCDLKLSKAEKVLL